MNNRTAASARFSARETARHSTGRSGRRSRRVAATLSLLLIGLGLSTSPDTAGAADMVIAMPNWPSGQATANILKVAIEAEFGLDVEVREVGALGAFSGLEDGTIAVHPEVWRPNYDDLIRRFVTEKQAVALSARSVEAWQGLCATEGASKLGIRSVDDLADATKTTALDTDGDGKGEIWIGAAAWLSTGIERIRADSYGYGKAMTLVEAEEDVAMAAVDAAVATGQPMVFYCYSPHHLFKLHKITRIEEPAYDAAKWKVADPSDPMWISRSSAPVAWDAARFHIAYSGKFKKLHPEIARFLENVDFTEGEITDMSYALQVERQVPSDYAAKWMSDHKARVKGWANP